ncbi:hypothetical protein [Geminisphaera colitermitum]|uniref:hypothetical protein n=1 Tax=Geminisphaera colitermitum TaxID=1148786 RepID=UPI000158C61C|nr:hypothetical protein [Geminisphaera colitermitum]
MKPIGQLLADDHDMATQRARAQLASAHVAGLAAAETDPQLPHEQRRYHVRLAMTAFREAVVTATTSEEAIRLAVAAANDGSAIKPGLLFHTTYTPYSVRLYRWGKWHDLPCHDVAPPAITREVHGKTARWEAERKP